MPEFAKQFAKGAGRSAKAAKGALRANVLFTVVNLAADQAVDTAQLANGAIDAREYRCRTAENVGSAAGSLGGTALGAAIGTALFPGVGTAVGAFLGGWLGSDGGKAVAGSLAR